MTVDEKQKRDLEIIRSLQAFLAVTDVNANQDSAELEVVKHSVYTYLIEGKRGEDFKEAVADKMTEELGLLHWTNCG